MDKDTGSMEVLDCNGECSSCSSPAGTRACDKSSSIRTSKKCPKCGEYVSKYFVKSRYFECGDCSHRLKWI